MLVQGLTFSNTSPHVVPTRAKKVSMNKKQNSVLIVLSQTDWLPLLYGVNQRKIILSGFLLMSWLV